MTVYLARQEIEQRLGQLSTFTALFIQEKTFQCFHKINNLIDFSLISISILN
jgi:hypothetical protein